MEFDSENPAFQSARQIYQVLVMYYLDGKKQSDIATQTGLSVASVNRLIRQGRESGMVEITIKSPWLSAHQLENDLAQLGQLQQVVVAPNVASSEEQSLQMVGSAAADYLLSRLKDGDVIAITGGKGVSALVEALQTTRKYDVQIVPALGCVQGKHYTDVNHVASEMAARLGGHAWQIHAPLFTDSASEREMLMSISAVNRVLDKARNATLAVIGLGSIHADSSSYYDLNLAARHASASIETSGARSELLAWLLDAQGQPAPFDANQRLIGLTLPELQRIPFSMAVVAGSNKVDPIHCALRGRWLKGIVTDESTAAGVLDLALSQGGSHG
ncbi:Crp/Fnr family transcriptional regulator [Izhakiella australiensis]|uniref:Crp/Fnr family transcriptional regulator n=1 Tax=Izhakiella australiensis TaxID=1926881 RepID=A0A1S8YL49_9GAMM|nr:sugar-binding transcriptional regulator [Izhakiella australiensis]OON39831.1 Crp/Fnr family transcriptional regulator [Izhakiella australiensis]